MYVILVLTLLAVFVGFANCFSWDIVMSGGKVLEFYYNGTVTHTEDIPSAVNIISITYDPVANKVLFIDGNYPYMAISSFDLPTGKTQVLVKINADDHHMRVVYDPVTHLLIWKNEFSIYSLPINPWFSSKAVNGNLLVNLIHYPHDIALDSCGGYIYWITDFEIERARFDGSQREVIIDTHANDRRSLVIDQQTQKMYWIETSDAIGKFISRIECANLYGTDRTTLYIIKNSTFASSLAISKDFFYWQNYNAVEIWQLPKNRSVHVERTLYSVASLANWSSQLIATNYTVKEQIQGIEGCDTLRGLIVENSNSESELSKCQNYCFQGDCSVTAEGQPICSCKNGYIGERCEVNPCHKHCLHNGVCSLNEEDEPICGCTAGYEGERCDVATAQIGNCANNSTEKLLREVRNEVRQVRQEMIRIKYLVTYKFRKDDTKCT